MTDRTGYPALLVDRFTPLYDLFAKLFMPEKQIKRDIIALAQIGPGQKVLDLGAGTGTLSIMIKQAVPDAKVVGLDTDPVILSIAREKAYRAGVEVGFVQGSALSLPHPHHTFDVVLMTLVLSLLPKEHKTSAMQNLFRVLLPGGKFFLADFVQPRTRWGKAIGRRMHRFEPISDNLDGLLPVYVEAAGFVNTKEQVAYTTILGTLAILGCQKPNIPNET